MNKLELLRTFVRVTDLSSFTQAADNLGLPKSTASEHVQALEELVGARLLHRTSRKVQATQDGLVLYERCKDMLAHMDELEGMFRQDGIVLAGRLRVDMPTAMARKLVMPHLGEFLRRHPKVQLEISSTDRRVDLVREGFDCVVRVGDLPDASLVARPLGRLALMNVASPTYLAEHGTPHTLEDLAHHQLVHYVSVLGARSSGFEYLANGVRAYVPMAGAVTVSSTDAYEAACLGGLGLIQAPMSGMREHLESGRLVAVLPDYVPAPMEVSVLYAHRRHLPQRARVMMDWLAELIERETAMRLR
jgi:DNA-binding transcriptional LysR family regulator